MDHRKTNADTKEEVSGTEKGSTDSSISKLASSHYNNFTVLKNQTKKMYFYIYLRY